MFRIIETKKSVEAYNLTLSFLTKATKPSASCISLYWENKYLRSKFFNNSENSTLLKKNYSTKNSNQYGIPPITSELSNDRTCSFTVVEHRKTAEEAKLSAFQAKGNAKRKIFEIKKMHLWNKEIEAQYRAELAEWEISSKKKIDLLETQNAKNIEINLSSLSNKDFHTLQSPKISFPINCKAKNADFQDEKISNNFDECKNSFPRKIFPKQPNNSAEVNRSQVHGFIDQ